MNKSKSPWQYSNETKAPMHYTASESFGGVIEGAEYIEWMVACRGREFVIHHMIAELGSKAQRLFLNKNIEKALEDIFKIEQACCVLKRLLSACPIHTVEEKNYYGSNE